MKLPTQAYEIQAQTWPKTGRHILAHHDDSSIVVYQAYRLSIAQFAIAHGYFGGPDFSFSRMSWIKPNFLWMMYRSGWGTKEGQECVLGLRVRREFFDQILERAVPSSNEPGAFGGHDEWKAAVEASEARLQWDPDHSPSGAKLERRAIQLGLRGQMLRAFATSELLEVIDMTRFVSSERIHALGADLGRLRTPLERVYIPHSPQARERVRIDS